MFDTKTRNSRILTASVRLARATAVAEKAEEALKRKRDAADEVEWLRNSPVSDGKSGEDLPTEDEISAYVEARRKASSKTDEQPVVHNVDVGDGSDPDNGIGPAFSGPTL